MIVCRVCREAIKTSTRFWDLVSPDLVWVHTYDERRISPIGGSHCAEPFDTTEEQEQAMTETRDQPPRIRQESIARTAATLDTVSRQWAAESSPNHELLLSESDCRRMAELLERNGFEVAPIQDVRDAVMKEAGLKPKPTKGITFNGREIRNEVSLTEGILSGADVQTVMHGNLDDATVFVRSHGDTEERPITALALVWRRDDER